MNDPVANRFLDLGIGMPRFAIPASNVDLFRWAVIACDQHTAEPHYWEEVDSIVGDAPSALRMILPEVYLSEPDVADREKAARLTMERYLSQGVLTELEPGFILAARSTPHVECRQGLVLALDLEKYDFRAGAKQIIRSTERTIEERLPPRVRIRDGAQLEVPHVLVLIDDADDLVFGALGDCDPPQIYNTELMLGGGSITGYHLAQDNLEPLAVAFEELLERASGEHPILFAVGDGNHSLAAAKTVWEGMKGHVRPDHPARFAAVEVVNLYDPGLRFEPIHRLVTVDDAAKWVDGFARKIRGTVDQCPSDEIQSGVGPDAVGFVAGDRSGLIRLDSNRGLPVTAVENCLESAEVTEIDYLHGWDTSLQLGARPNKVVLLMPPIDAGMLFHTVAEKGVLPRKAFSLGEAEEKRYYLEARRLTP